MPNINREEAGAYQATIISDEIVFADGKAQPRSEVRDVDARIASFDVLRGSELQNPSQLTEHYRAHLESRQDSGLSSQDIEQKVSEFKTKANHARNNTIAKAGATSPMLDEAQSKAKLADLIDKLEGPARDFVETQLHNPDVTVIVIDSKNLNSYQPGSSQPIVGLAGGNTIAIAAQAADAPRFLAEELTHIRLESEKGNGGKPYANKQSPERAELVDGIKQAYDTVGREQLAKDVGVQGYDRSSFHTEIPAKIISMKAAGQWTEELAGKYPKLDRFAEKMMTQGHAEQRAPSQQVEQDAPPKSQGYDPDREVKFGFSPEEMEEIKTRENRRKFGNIPGYDPDASQSSAKGAHTTETSVATQEKPSRLPTMDATAADRAIVGNDGLNATDNTQIRPETDSLRNQPPMEGPPSKPQIAPEPAEKSSKTNAPETPQLTPRERAQMAAARNGNAPEGFEPSVRQEASTVTTGQSQSTLNEAMGQLKMSEEIAKIGMKNPDGKPLAHPDHKIQIREGRAYVMVPASTETLNAAKQTFKEGVTPIVDDKGKHYIQVEVTKDNLDKLGPKTQERLNNFKENPAKPGLAFEFNKDPKEVAHISEKSPASMNKLQEAHAHERSAPSAKEPAKAPPLAPEQHGIKPDKVHMDSPSAPHARSGKISGLAGVAMSANSLAHGDFKDKTGTGLAIADLATNTAQVVVENVAKKGAASAAGVVLQHAGTGIMALQGAYETKKAFVENGSDAVGAMAATGKAAETIAATGFGVIAGTAATAAATTAIGGSALAATTTGAVVIAGAGIAATAGVGIVAGAAVVGANMAGAAAEEKMGIGDKLGSAFAGGQALDKSKPIEGKMVEGQAEKLAKEQFKTKESVAKDLLSSTNEKGEKRFGHLEEYMKQHPELKLDHSSPQSLQKSVDTAVNKMKSDVKDATGWTRFSTDQAKIDTINAARGEMLDYLKVRNAQHANENAPEQKIAGLNAEQKQKLDAQLASSGAPSKHISGASHTTHVAAPTVANGKGPEAGQIRA